jgi:hypothetical protein
VNLRHFIYFLLTVGIRAACVRHAMLDHLERKERFLFDDVIRLHFKMQRRRILEVSELVYVLMAGG